MGTQQVEVKVVGKGIRTHETSERADFVGKLLYCHGCFILMLNLDDFGALGVSEVHKCPFTFNVFLFSLRCAMLSPSFITRCPGIQSLYKNYACYLETRMN